MLEVRDGFGQERARPCRIRRLMAERRLHEPEDPVRFAIGGIDRERGLSFAQRFGRLVLPRVQPGELGVDLGGFRNERERLLVGRDRLVHFAVGFEPAALHEQKVRLPDRRGWLSGRLPGGRRLQGQTQRDNEDGRRHEQTDRL